MKTIGKILCGFGRGLRIGLVAIGALAFTGSVIAVADYSATQGTGTTFASIVISTKHYFANVICDATIGETQCQTVDSSGNAHVDAPSGSALLTAVEAGTATTGSATPASAILNGVTDGTDLRGMAGDAKGNVKVIDGASIYQAEPASTSITALTGGSGGATGDYLSHCTVIPTTVSPGVFTITDGSTAIYSFPGGTSSLSNLVPWTVPVGAVSVTGAWKVTTGAGLSIVCVGRFT